MNYLERIYRITEKDSKKNTLIEKAIEKYYDSSGSNNKVTAVAVTNLDELDNVEYLKKKDNYKLVLLDKDSYKELKIAVAVFEIIEEHKIPYDCLTIEEVKVLFYSGKD